MSVHRVVHSRQVFVFISLITPILAIYLQDLNVQETYLGDVKEFFNKEQTKAKYFIVEPRFNDKIWAQG